MLQDLRHGEAVRNTARLTRTEPGIAAIRDERVGGVAKKLRHHDQCVRPGERTPQAAQDIQHRIRLEVDAQIEAAWEGIAVGLTG